MKTIKTLALFGALLLAPAAAFAAPISPQQALGMQGQNVIVEGVATVSEADGVPGLFVHLNAEDRSPFVGYVSANNEDKFPDLSQLQGKTVDISGVVEISNGRPMIRLSSADQIKIVE